MNGYPRQPPLRPPSQLGKKVQNFIYQYSDQIGKGNFARVYKGLNLNTRTSPTTQNKLSLSNLSPSTNSNPNTCKPWSLRKSASYR